MLLLLHTTRIALQKTRSRKPPMAHEQSCCMPNVIGQKQSRQCCGPLRSRPFAIATTVSSWTRLENLLCRNSAKQSNLFLFATLTLGALQFMFSTLVFREEKGACQSGNPMLVSGFTSDTLRFVPVRSHWSSIRGQDMFRRNSTWFLMMIFRQSRH